MRELLVAFIVDAVLAGAGVFLFIARESQQTQSVFQGARSAYAMSRAMQAYQHEEPAVAVWELRHLADMQSEELRDERVHTNEVRAALLMTRARLAKLYHEQGREPEAQTNAQMAIALPGTNTTVTNLPSLLDRLRQTDAQSKKEPKYE
jgi:hypothetical protein